MAIHPNSGVEFDEKDSDAYPKDDGAPKGPAVEQPDELGYDKADGAVERRGETFPATEEKRKTVNVHSPRALKLHIHKTVDDDGGGRPFQGRALDSAVTLSAGHTAGIDKEFFDAWLKQNTAFAEQLGITAEDEGNPETESAKREE